MAKFLHHMQPGRIRLEIYSLQAIVMLIEQGLSHGYKMRSMLGATAGGEVFRMLAYLLERGPSAFQNGLCKFLELLACHAAAEVNIVHEALHVHGCLWD